MKYVDFRKFTDEHGAMPIYLFEGEEIYFSSKGEALLQSRYVSQPLLDYAAFDGAGLKGDKLSALADAVNSFPFMSEKRLVKVTELYPTEKDFETYLLPLFNNPPSSAILLIVNSGKGKAGTVSLAKQPNVTFIDCGKADEETIKKWIYVTCKREGIYADGVTCGKITAYCVSDMARIAKETEKLLCYCKAEGKDRLTDEIVDLLVYPDSEYKLYEMTDALARKNYGAFMRIVGELSTKGANELSLLSALSSYFKTLYEVSMMKGSDKEIGAVLGLKEFVVRKNREQALKFSTNELLRTYTGIYEGISGIKCGTLTPQSALKTIIARLFFANS